MGPTVLESPLKPERVFAGRFTLREKLGEGGMGDVWIADEHAPVQRRVALKIVRAGFDSGRLLVRFEQERQALALMDHPNIAKVLDAGIDETGRSYFAMELIQGVPITTYCDEAKLPPRRRLELFIAVCHAVQHAHQKGIIHRDLKPSNILVGLYDGVAVPKVIDFGVAKATGPRLTEHSIDTEVGALIGTPEYMSPEQAELNNLDIDTRSDIYALGVVLYELLAGSPPFTRKEVAQGGVLEMLRVIREQEPARPGTKLSTAERLPKLAANRSTEPARLTKMVRGELDWIVMKALDKDRNRRYETANSFALDVQRYLADEPVLAGPPTARYRLRKFLKRNKGPAIAVSVILLCLVAGIIGTSAGLAWALRERDHKARALIAETEAHEAEKQARVRALTALGDLTEDIVENQMARATHLTEENQEFLRKIIRHVEGVAALTGDDAQSRAIRAEGLYRVGLMRHRLGELKSAEMAYTDALAIQKQLAAALPDRPELHQVLARTHNNLGVLLRARSRLKEAETAYTDALVIRKQLSAAFPLRPEFRQELASTLTNLGVLLSATDRLKEAETAYTDALAIYQQLAVDFGNRPVFRQELARCHNNLGVLFVATDRLKKAETAYGDALAIQKQLVADFPLRPEFRQEVARSHGNLGNLLRATNRPKEAERAYADGLTIYKDLAAKFPARPEFRQELASTVNNRGILFYNSSRQNEAETAWTDALAILRQLAADFPIDPDLHNRVAGTLGNLGNLCNRRRDFKGAKAYLEEALPHHEAALRANPQHPNYKQYYRNNLSFLVRAHAGLQDRAAALHVAQKARDLGSDPGNAYDAACVLALCIPVVEKDDQLDAANRQAAVQFYGDQAMAMLRAAVARGYKNAERVTQDKDLDALRGREDFKELLAALQAKKQ
jgi:serine/threonine protein kinase/tetratricopeptide (TPR) repeat protein